MGWANKVKKVKVAVIDTGVDPKLLKGNSYCKSGHRDFTGQGLDDHHGHGTHISGIIDQYAKNYIFDGKSYSKIDSIEIEYCQIIIKYWDSSTDVNTDPLMATIKALRYAIDQEVDIINYSGGGNEESKEEKELIKEALDKGIKVVAAAGNGARDKNGSFKGYDISKKPYYPAAHDPRIYVVGNITKTNTIVESSNTGNNVKYWEVGDRVLSRLPGSSYGYMTGTSQATAVKTGKLVRETLINKGSQVLPR